MIRALARDPLQLEFWQRVGTPSIEEPCWASTGKRQRRFRPTGCSVVSETSVSVASNMMRRVKAHKRIDGNVHNRPRIRGLEMFIQFTFAAASELAMTWTRGIREVQAEI